MQTLFKYKSSSRLDNQTVRAELDRPFILVREDRDLSISYFFSSYLESKETEKIYFNDKVYTGLKLLEPTARKTALWQGWTCITEQYYAEPVEDTSTASENTNEVTIDVEVKPKTKAKAKTPRRRVKK